VFDHSNWAAFLLAQMAAKEYVISLPNPSLPHDVSHTPSPSSYGTLTVHNERIMGATDLL